MKNTLVYAALGLALLVSGPVSMAQNPGDPIPDRYIVELKPGAKSQTVGNRHGATIDHEFSNALKGFAGIVPTARLKALKADAQVASVTEDRVVAAYAKGGKPGSGGGGTSGGGASSRAKEVVPAGVERIGAIPGLSSITGLGVGVAVVDTGLDLTHPDLNCGAISFKAALSRQNRLQLSEGTTVGQDDQGHGTHVGGIIGARFDGYDVVGVAPATTLFAVKVLDANGRGSDSTVMAGLDWIARNAATASPPIKVINMSLGRPGSLGDNPSYRNAISALRSLGITVVVAAGNTATLEVSGQVPATYPEVIAVASTTAKTGQSDISFQIKADTASYFTTDGRWDPSTGIGVTISAPGEEREDISGGNLVTVGILSTRLGGGTARSSGTSMAAPHVAGVAALLYEQTGGTISPESARTRIMQGTLTYGTAPLDSPTSGYSFDGAREGVVEVSKVLQ